MSEPRPTPAPLNEIEQTLTRALLDAWARHKSTKPGEWGDPDNVFYSVRRAVEVLAPVVAALALPPPAARPASEPARVLANISSVARRGLSFGHQATPQTPERIIERKEQALRQILELTGVQSSPLRTPAQAEPAAPLDGVGRIAAERARQMAVEGWSSEHDDEHVQGEMSQAAAGYAVAWSKDAIVPVRWPWERSWWKPSDDRVRNLEKAGALIAAEIDRLQRLATLARPTVCRDMSPGGDGLATGVCCLPTGHEGNHLYEHIALAARREVPLARPTPATVPEQCGEDHIVGSRPDDCFVCLSEHRDRLLAALKIAQPAFCSLKCPSVFRGPDSERHIPACIEMQAAIEEAGAPAAVPTEKQP